jgi:hypothetical protein
LPRRSTQPSALSTQHPAFSSQNSLLSHQCSALSTQHQAPSTQHSALCTLHSALCTLHSALSTQHSAFSTQRAAAQRQCSTAHCNLRPFCCTEPLLVKLQDQPGWSVSGRWLTTATLHSTLSHALPFCRERPGDLRSPASHLVGSCAAVTGLKGELARRCTWRLLVPAVVAAEGGP